jgi:hypothetical protein
VLASADRMYLEQGQIRGPDPERRDKASVARPL